MTDFEFFRRVTGQHVGVKSSLKQIVNVGHPLRHFHDLRLAGLRLQDRLFQMFNPVLRLIRHITQRQWRSEGAAREGGAGRPERY